MNRLLNPGQIMFAVGIGCLGILCIIYGDFIIGRPPVWPARLNFVPALGYVAGGVTIVAVVIMLISGKRAGAAALVVAGLILLLSVFRHIPVFMNDWLNGFKAMALFGGALIAASSFFNNHAIFATVKIAIKSRKRMITIGVILLGAFFIAAGYAHYKFADFVKDFIPSYIPFHIFWTYFTAVCLVAGGIGIVIPFTRSWAALLSGFMVLGWFLLLHIPRFIANMNDASDRMGLCESFTFSGVFFILFISSKRS